MRDASVFFLVSQLLPKNSATVVDVHNQNIWFSPLGFEQNTLSDEVHDAIFKVLSTTKITSKYDYYKKNPPIFRKLLFFTTKWPKRPKNLQGFFDNENEPQ